MFREIDRTIEKKRGVAKKVNFTFIYDEKTTNVTWNSSWAENLIELAD